MSDYIEHDDPPSPTAMPPSGNRDSDFTEFADDNMDNDAHMADSHHSEHAEHPDHSEFAEHIEQSDHPLTRPSLSRRSTIMLNEEELASVNPPEDPHEEQGLLSGAREGDQIDLTRASQTNDGGLVETVIEWKEGGNSVFVTGSFTGWRQMIPLRKFDDNVFGVVLKLAPGTHRLRFVVDGELRCSNEMNTATDSMGNLVNYLEVTTDSQIEGDEQFDEYEQAPKYEYTRQIPDLFADPEALDRFSSIEFTLPPQLPPHLDGVILNTNWTEKDNNSVLPIPNHVVLNHLATTSIKHNLLAVASVSRYRAKYITQILYSPIEGI